MAAGGCTRTAALHDRRDGGVSVEAEPGVQPTATTQGERGMGGAQEPQSLSTCNRIGEQTGALRSGLGLTAASSLLSVLYCTPMECVLDVTSLKSTFRLTNPCCCLPLPTVAPSPFHHPCSAPRLG
jgi:hypothetical protein